MEDMVRQKDATSYVIFACIKCNNFIYAKSSQKSKKCVRCGYKHQVSEIINHGEIIKGISNAIKLIKRKQNELAIKELGSEPEFRASRDFKIVPKIQNRKDINVNYLNYDFVEKFKLLLYDLSKTHKFFPYYIIEIMAEKYDIPASEVKILTRKLLREGFLIQLQKNYMYRINGEK